MTRGEVTGHKPMVTADPTKRKPGPSESSTRDERPPPAAYSIREFCAAHRLSESMYFKLRNQGLGPDEMSVGSRRIISFEAAERWRREREAAAIDAA
jgi:hypothetical protein